MGNVLEIKDLRKQYDGFLLKDISFSLPEGYVMGFIGPNGAGKTTTIKLIMNLIRRDAGEIEVCGFDNIANEQEMKEQIGFVYDENYYYEELTVNEIKRIVAPFYRNWDEGVYQQYLKLFELPAHKKIKALSKGMKMKFSLALALSHQARFLIMDEPTSGLDPVFRSELLDILRGYLISADRGVLFSSHVTSDLDKIADYVTLINNGEILLCCSKEELLGQYGLVKGDKRLLEEGLRRELIGLQENSFGFTALTKSAANIAARRYENLLVERPSLEDIMLYMIRGEKHV